MPRHTASFVPVLSATLACLAPAPPAAADAPAASLDQAQARLNPLLQDRAQARAAAGVWKAPLDSPVALHDPSSGRTVSGREDGWRPVALPRGTPPANTCVELDGTRVALLVLPLPEDRDELARLFWHERWHCAQEGLGLTASEAANDHLDREAGRTWLRLELRALGRAIASEDEAGARAHAQAALAFRRQRTGGDAQAAAGETGLERNEGLAEYTAWRVAHGEDAASARRGRLAAALARADAQDSYVRSFAYFTGPAYGHLLDRWRPGWRASVAAAGGDLPRMLAEALDAPPRDAGAQQLAAGYGGEQVAAEERQRAAQRERRNAQLRARFIDGPALRLPLQQPSISFDPRSLFPLDGEGTYYATLTVKDVWGELSAPRGALLANDWRNVRVAAPDLRGCGDRWSSAGGGWQLRLAAGWTLRRESGGAPGLVRSDAARDATGCGTE